MVGITGGDPSFLTDDGTADPDVAASLAAFAAGEGSEHAALTAVADSRLLVPVVAAVNDGAKSSEMAMPTLIGMDGRRAMPAFTSLEAMRRWRHEARPVPVAALQVWQAAVQDDCAVVIDVGGPVPFAVEGARLAALARGEAAPLPADDCDVHEIVSSILADQLAVASFELRPAGAEQDLAIALTLASGTAQPDVADLAAVIGNAVMARLGGRMRRGVAIWLS